jgi:hypothetical protein
LQGGYKAWEGYTDTEKQKLIQGLLEGAGEAAGAELAAPSMLANLAEALLRKSLHNEGHSQEEIDDVVQSIKKGAFDAALAPFTGGWVSSPDTQVQTATDALTLGPAKQ